LAVRQNWQLTAQPTWLETQMVARRKLLAEELLGGAADAPSAPGVSEDASFSSLLVAFRHPDGFYGLAAGLDQVAFGAVDAFQDNSMANLPKSGPIIARLLCTIFCRGDGDGNLRIELANSLPSHMC
jgi:hypothetical protein